MKRILLVFTLIFSVILLFPRDYTIDIQAICERTLKNDSGLTPVLLPFGIH